MFNCCTIEGITCKKYLCSHYCNVFILPARSSHQRVEVYSVSCVGVGFVRTGL